MSASSFGAHSPTATACAARGERSPCSNAEPPADDSALLGERTGEGWISRRVAVNGIISVAWQQISCGKHRAGRRVDVHVQDSTLQIWDGPELIKTVLRTTTKEVRKKHAARAS